MVLLLFGEGMGTTVAYMVLAPTVNLALIGAILGWIAQRFRRARAG
jgi:hypothetical protein